MSGLKFNQLVGGNQLITQLTYGKILSNFTRIMTIFKVCHFKLVSKILVSLKVFELNACIGSLTHLNVTQCS